MPSSVFSTNSRNLVVGILLGSARDYPVIQAMILLTSGIDVAVNLLIHVAYTLLDPRIRY